jgi:hypothetical protein
MGTGERIKNKKPFSSGEMERNARANRLTKKLKTADTGFELYDKLCFDLG